MGVIIPSIPYKSQYDEDAVEFRNDCGPASLAMILRAFGVNVSTDAVYKKTGAIANRYVSIGQLMRAGLAYDVPFDYFYNWTIEKLQTSLHQGHAVITLVHYGAWSKINPGISTQNTFQGPHFVVVLGYDEKYIYVNDPLWKEDRRSEGYRHAWTHAEFMAAWESNHLDGNRERSGITSIRSLPTKNYGPNDLDAAIPQFELHPEESQRLKAWISYFSLPEPDVHNPASMNAYQSAMSKWGHRIALHTLSPEDDLSLIAQKYYGDREKWPVILAFNGLTQSDTLHDGIQLKIPEPLENPSPIPEEQMPRGGTFIHSDIEKERPSPLAPAVNLEPLSIFPGTILGDNSSKS